MICKKLLSLRGLSIREVAERTNGSGMATTFTQKVIKGTTLCPAKAAVHIAIETAVADLLGLTHAEAWGLKSSSALRRLIRQEIKKKCRKREKELQQQFLHTGRLPEKGAAGNV